MPCDGEQECSSQLLVHGTGRDEVASNRPRAHEPASQPVRKDLPVKSRYGSITFLSFSQHGLLDGAHAAGRYERRITSRRHAAVTGRLDERMAFAGHAAWWQRHTFSDAAGAPDAANGLAADTVVPRHA